MNWGVKRLTCVVGREGGGREREREGGERGWRERERERERERASSPLFRSQWLQDASRHRRDLCSAPPQDGQPTCTADNRQNMNCILNLCSLIPFTPA